MPTVTPATAWVPSGIDAVDPAWLTEALGATVTDVVAERIAEDSGFSSLLYRLHLSGGDGVPPTLIAKLPAQSEARGAMELLGGYRRELSFYAEVAGRAPMQTPHVYAARMAENSVDFVLLLEDLRDWDNADHLAGLSFDRAQLAIDRAGRPARLVAGAVEYRCRWSTSRALDMPAVRDLLVPAFAPGWQIYREHTSCEVPARVARFAERFAEHAPTALAALTERSMLLHGDIRADNMFFDGDRLKVVDFQFACVRSRCRRHRVSGQPGTADRGSPRPRRAAGPRLPGMPWSTASYSFDEAWRHYRLRGRLPDGAARDHADRLGRAAGAFPGVVPDADRPRGGRHRRDRCRGGVRSDADRA